jgi:hypothetical protein
MQKNYKMDTVYVLYPIVTRLFSTFAPMSAITTEPSQAFGARAAWGSGHGSSG